MPESIYLTNSEKYRQIGGGIEKPVAGISRESKHVRNARKFITYMLDNSKEMKLDVKNFEEK